jgi:dihydroorotate dehydrogenase
MRLRGIDFGSVWGASGVQGFFGEGYWFHHLGKPFGLDFNGVTFVAKTTTLNAREGNMPLRGDLTPAERFPKCIVAKPFKGAALNSVGLSGPGAEALFKDGRWQKAQNSFFISFMSVAGSAKERTEELRQFVDICKKYLPTFRAPVGLQINYSCPNTGLHVEELIGEVADGLAIAAQLAIPLVPKFNVVLPVEIACDIAAHPACDALCVSNTIPWGQLPEKIDWEGIFGSNQSPLAHLGGGGLSGKPLLPLLLDWLTQAREAGLAKPINAGGGILSKQDARMVLDAGADSIFIGSVAFLRPWRVRGITTEAMRRTAVSRGGKVECM